VLIKEEMDKGIKASRIILGGFSQGGAMSVFAGVTNKENLFLDKHVEVVTRAENSWLILIAEGFFEVHLDRGR
jgi:hypothetical protein